MHRFLTLAAFALVSAPATAAETIIPLPLQPVVPAAQRTCAAKTSTGLGFAQLRTGTGAKPAKDDVVLVNYIGYLTATGAVFDQGMRSAFPVSGVIPGFGEGLQLASKGSVMRLCIPAALGYGAAGTGPIPANADLVFQVELLDFKSQAEIDALRQQAASTPAAATPAPN